MEESVPDTTDFSITMGDITSPSQLQEVTLDQDTFSNSMGMRSPGGPMRGRSVKEFEEQLANLKKENFNLKLRIYFLEERMGVNFNLDKENVIKKNVELMVEVESLRKEVQEKHDFLCTAVKAMELEEEEHKRLMVEKEEAAEEYHVEIENLKQQLLDAKAESEAMTSRSYQSSATGFYSTQTQITPENSHALKNLQDKIQLLEEELVQEKESNAAVQIILDQNDAKIKSLSSQLEEANKQMSRGDEDLTHVNLKFEEMQSKCQNLYKKLQEKMKIVDELCAENEDLRNRQLSMGDVDKERKRYERLKVSSEQKISELQNKLEASLAELKKSQDLVVSSEVDPRRTSSTDVCSFSVSKPATPAGSPQKDSLVFPAVSSPLITPASSPSHSFSRFSSASSAPDFTEATAAQNDQTFLEQLQEQRDAQHQKIVKLKAEQIKACKIIKSMMQTRNQITEEMALLKQKNEQLEKELEGVVSKQRVDVSNKGETATSENSMEEQSGELIDHYKTLVDELDEKTTILEATLKEKDNQMKRLLEQHEDLKNNLKERSEHIVDLEFELLSTVQGKTSETYLKQLEEKDEEIEKLNNKLKKKNCDLQRLVNNELWEKNREIEKLQKKQSTKMFNGKDQEIEKLQHDLESKEKQLGLIKQTISELGIEVDIDSAQIIENNLQAELEKSEKLRFEANNVCSTLSTRLEELAVFLDSLLKQKSVLGFLGNKESSRLRQIVDKSLDLSRSFTMSMIINPDQSLMQLTNISSVLNETQEESRLSLVPSNVSLTYKSHLHRKEDTDNTQIIDTLRQQIVNLKYELQLRDVELNKINQCALVTSSDKEDEAKGNLNTTSTTLKYKSEQSESEAWSEPDLSVSKARIGLLEISVSKKSVKHTSDSTEEEDLNKSSKSSKRCILNESRSTILDLHKQVCELDQKLSEKEIAYYEVTRSNNRLRQDIAALDVKLEEMKDKRDEAIKKADELQTEKEELLENMTHKDKHMQDKINQFEVEKSEALAEAEAVRRAVEMVQEEIRLTEEKLLQRENKIDDLEDIKMELEEKLQTLQAESAERISEIQDAAEREMETLKNSIQQLQQDYLENYLKTYRVAETFEEVERLREAILSLDKRTAQLKQEREIVIDKHSECEGRINDLRIDLDDATLQYSEAVLEKTKIANDKTLLEQELSRSVLKEVDLMKRLEKVESEYHALCQEHQKQIALLINQKSTLEVQVSELESSNAQLHNRLVKIQTGCGDQAASPPTSIPPNFVNQIVSFRRQHSDLAEEPHSPLEHRLNRMPLGLNFDLERHEANSSPDLGIESDHGRFSSLETHLVQRPLLQTLELTESMSNLLEADRSEMQLDCDNSHCCQKTMEMVHENSELKRKLLRTRRALEETVTQLTLANQRKKQVEKTICRQIHKTSQVLRKAKANLDSGSETDLYKK